ncbi:DUF3997 domain-containing protein [Bacillus tianshenii]|nr:DUF3997 domain-containing protein [Bacillus tianshenii]
MKIALKKNEDIWGSEVIPTKVTEVAWNDNYILAKQVGLKEDPDSSNGYKIPNKDDVNFWILNYKSVEVFGPLGSNDFIKKKNKLEISQDVELKKIQDIK